MTDSGDGKKQRTAGGVALVTNINRAAGACCILAAPVLAFNLDSFADRLGLDGMVAKILGGALLVIGLLDFFVMPAVFQQMFQKKSGSSGGPDEAS